MTRTFILLCTGVFAIAYALYELKHMGVYYPDASNPQLFTGWKAVTELGPAILATGIAATAFSLWLFILFFRSSESRRIQRETAVSAGTEGGRRGAYRQTKYPYSESQPGDSGPAKPLQWC
jgi:heme/copper-type cytochrome/quinol oxidase subunit 1